MATTIEILKSKVFAIILLLAVFFVPAALGNRPALRFNSNGKFRILQFTDIHFKYGSFRSDSALHMMQRAVRQEKPDLVVLTGDVVCSENTRKAWQSLADPFIKSGIPWAVTLGNHDIEYELSGRQIIDLISGMPNCLTVNGPDDISGNGNYILQIISSNNSNAAALLYFMDSHSGLPAKSELGTYDWIDFDQINWYRKESKKFTAMNGNIPLPALAFFHIPLPEYKEVTGKENTFGIQEEAICSPDLNTGLYTALIESGDVMGMFVGHDHDNNYIGCLRNICLAYGQASGRETYGKIGKGYRVIDLYENGRKFDTWVRIKYHCDREKDTWTPVKDDRPEFFVTYPGSFLKH